MKKNQNRQSLERRLLCRTLAKELKPEDLGLVGGGDPPPNSTTMMATLPDYREDE
jgi:hypothetical protein